MDRPIVTRAEAKAQGLKRYFTGKPCVNGHVAERSIHCHCLECVKVHQAAHESTDKRRASKKAAAQTDKWKEYRKTYRASAHAAHPHVGCTNVIRYKYPDAIVSLTSAEQSRVRWFYVTARELSERTGVKFHVDHCFPLKLGGLHHPLNLMVLPARVNMQKQSKYHPDNPLAVRGMQLKDRLSLRISIPS